MIDKLMTKLNWLSIPCFDQCCVVRTLVLLPSKTTTQHICSQPMYILYHNTLAASDNNLFNLSCLQLCQVDYTVCT